MTERENMSKKLNKYFTALNYAEKTLLVLSIASSGAFFCSLITNVIGKLFETASASDSLVLLISNGVVKMFLKAMKRK